MLQCINDGCTRNRARTRGLQCIVCRNTKSRYGISGIERDLLLDAQQGRCAICEKPITFNSTSFNTACIDHCHDTGMVRGILCGKCNTAIGHLGDSIPTLRSAISYLQQTGDSIS